MVKIHRPLAVLPLLGVIINSYYVMTSAVSAQGGKPLSTFDLTDAMSSAGVVAKDAPVVRGCLVLLFCACDDVVTLFCVY